MPIDKFNPQASQMPIQRPIVTTSGKKKKKDGDIKLEKPSSNPKDIVDINPTINEASSGKPAVFTFGRMNPPTVGHEKLVNKVIQVAKQQGGMPHIFLSKTQDKNKNPLPYKVKLNMAKRAFGAKNVYDTNARTIIEILKELEKMGHGSITMVVGSDRVEEFNRLISKYNGKEYKFDTIRVVSAGERDPDSEGTEGMSATKMREFARKGDVANFQKGLPSRIKGQAKTLIKHIKEDVDVEEFDIDELENEILFADDIDDIINEEYEQEELINERVMTLMQRRKAAIKMRRLKFKILRQRKIKAKRMATQDMLTRRARRSARTWIRKRIAGAKGAKYASLSPSEKIQIDKRVEKKQAIIDKIAKRIMPKIKAAELVRLRKARSKVNEQFINSSFERNLSELRDGWTTSDHDSTWIQENSDNAQAITNEAEDPKVKALKDKQAREKEAFKDRQALEKERLKVSMAQAKSSKIRRETQTVAEAVDMMIDALVALEKKADKAGVDLDTLFVEFIDGYNNPHGQQTPQQGGFAAVNRLIAEMSQAEKDKAEDIVKGMKKKASYFRQKYGDKAKSVMYATANKMAQEDFKNFVNEIEESKGLWHNIHAKRKRIKAGSGEKMRAPGSEGAPTKADFERSQKDESTAYAYVTGNVPKPTERMKKGFGLNIGKMAADARRKKNINKMMSGRLSSFKLNEADEKIGKLHQLFRMGLARKGDLQTMMRAIKTGEKSLQNPKLRDRLYELLNKLIDIVTSDGQIYVKVRQSVMKNREDLQAVDEVYNYLITTIINESFELINIDEDMSGMSVSSGHKRSVEQGAGMTKKGVEAYRRRNPGSKLQTAVTTPPSKLKPGSKAAKRRKAFCSRSRSWTGERGKAARRRWNC